MKEVVDLESRFSTSKLWQLQEEAYKQYGISAWEKEGVPFYLTSSPYTANQAVRLALAYLDDQKERLEPNAPIYLFDLGAGTGRFAYLFLREFLPLAESLFGSAFRFCYVLTDIVDENIAFWQSHPLFRKWFDTGLLDCAYYHHTQKEAIQLIKSGDHLKTFQNPPLLFANYFFDTIPQDLFRVSGGQLEEGRVSLYNEGESRGASQIKSLECRYSYHLVESANYYKAMPFANRLLDYYRQRYDLLTFLFPCGAFEVLETFSALSQGSFFLYANDQGLVTEAQMKSFKAPRIDKHGTFSIGVSYHAIAEWFKMRGGLSCTTTDPDPTFVTIAAAEGRQMLPRLQAAFTNIVDAFEPKDYWFLGEALLKRELTVEELSLFLKLGRGDPVNVYTLYDQIAAKLPEASESEKALISRLVEQAAENLFPICKAEEELVARFHALIRCIR